jgi:hypothetical protein
VTDLIGSIVDNNEETDIKKKLFAIIAINPKFVTGLLACAYISDAIRPRFGMMHGLRSLRQKN